MSNAKQFFKRAQAIAATALPLGPRAVLNLLNLRCNGSGVCWPAMKTIAREIGCTERSVQNHLAELIAAGFVELVRGGGRGLSNRYRLNLPVQNVDNSSGFSDQEGEPNVENSSGFSGGGSVQNIETVAGNIEKFSLNTETVSIYPLRTTKKPIGGARNKFQKPNVEQVRQFAESNSLPISDAEPFCDHYESNGWRVGGRGLSN
ncbi:MAG: helix-turn-helix domain-containing protein, partial [Planctomyces sp.]